MPYRQIGRSWTTILSVRNPLVLLILASAGVRSTETQAVSDDDDRAL